MMPLWPVVGLIVFGFLFAIAVYLHLMPHGEDGRVVLYDQDEDDAA